MKTKKHETGNYQGGPEREGLPYYRQVLRRTSERRSSETYSIEICTMKNRRREKGGLGEGDKVGRKGGVDASVLGSFCILTICS